MNESALLELPRGWVWTKIKDISDLINGKAFKPDEWSTQGLPIIRIQNLNNINTDFNFCNFEVEEKYLVNNGQLLFAWSGTPGTSFGAHIWNRGKAVLNQHIFKVEINKSYVNKIFLMYLINRNIDEYIRKAHGTAGLAHITKNKFENSIIPLPPFPEQSRIVAKLEEFFTKLDAGVSALQKTQVQLKRYRQAVLNYAFEGKLTEDWRITHKNEIEPASLLLEHIKEETKKDAKRKIKELPSSDTSMLPEGWVYGKLEHLIYIAGRIGWRGLKAEEYTKEGPLFLSVYNLNKGNHVDFSDVYHISDERYDESPEIQLKNDDILLVKDGAGIGKLSIVKGLKTKATVNSSLLVIRSGKFFVPEYLFYFLKGPNMQRVVKERITGSATPHLFQRDIKKFELLIPPIKEQEKIVEEIERRLSIADEVAKTIEQSFAQAQRLRQSILKKAFEGKLVPQDPNDEPASVLLEKIKVEKARNVNVTKKPKQIKLSV